MNWVLRIQADRIYRLYEKEKEVQVPFKVMDKMIQVFKDVAESKLNFEIRLGIRDAKPSELNLLMKHRFEGLMQGALRGGGAPVIAAANRFLELAEENALTLEEVEEGTYGYSEDRDQGREEQ